MHRRPDRLPGTRLPTGSPPCLPPLLASLHLLALFSACGWLLGAACSYPERAARRFRAKACVREYELFQRSNAIPPASPARPAAPTAATPLALLAARPTAPRPLAFLATAPTPRRATARTRPLIDLLLAPRLYGAVPEIRPADFLRDPLGALRVERLPFILFTLLLRGELARERVTARLALRVPPREPLFPARFVVICAIRKPLLVFPSLAGTRPTIRGQLSASRQ